MVRMESGNPRYILVQPEVRIDDEPYEPDVPGGPRTPNTTTGPKPDRPPLPFDDGDLQLPEGRPYQDIVNDFNKCINKLNSYYTTLYNHETAYNKGDYSFAGGSKETAKSVIENDKSKIEELKTKLKELEAELDKAGTNDPIGAGKYKGDLKKYESYENYKKRMDEANKANGADDASSTGFKKNATLNTDNLYAMIGQMNAYGSQQTQGAKDSMKNNILNILKQVMSENEAEKYTANLLKDGKFDNNEMSNLLISMFNNGVIDETHLKTAGNIFKTEFTISGGKATVSTGSSGNVDGTDDASSVSGADDADSTGGANNSDPMSQQLDAELQALQSELDTLNGELDTLNEELNILNGELNSLNNDKATLEGKKSTLEQEINKLKAQLEKAQADVRRIQNTMNAMGLNHPAFDTVATQRQEVEALIAQLQSSIASKTSELSSINSQISNIDSAIQTKNGEIQTKNGEIQTKNNEITDKQGEIDGKQGEVDHRNTYVENNSDGSKMRFDTDYGVKDTSNDTTDGSLQTYLKQIKDNDGTPSDNQKQQLINLLTKYGVSNAEAYINKLLEGDGKITDTEIRNLLASLKDRINGNGQGNSYDKMINYIFPSNPINKNDTKALEKAIKDMGLRETNCKGVYCEQHNPSMPKGNYTHQRHYVWDPVNQKMVLLKDKSGNELYYISSNGNEAKSNEHLNKWLNGTYDYRLVHTGMDGKTTGYYGGPNGTNGTGGTESNTTIKTNAEKAKNILANAPNYGDISSAIASKNLGNICTRIGNTLGVYGISIDKDFNGARDAFGSAGQKLLGAINSNNNGQMTNDKSAAISDYTSKLSALLAQINKLLK